MAQGSLEAAIAALSGASSVDGQIAALRQLKNHAIGHDQRKELMVRHGLIDCLIVVLSSATKVTGKRRRTVVNGHVQQYSQAWTPEDEARLQAVLLTGTLATGGPSFVQPLLAAGALKALLDIFSADPAPRLVTATLRTLKSLASAWTAAIESTDACLQEPLDIFNKSSIDVFLDVLRDPQSSTGQDQQLRVVADIIALASISDSARKTLTQSHVLDAMADLLVSYSIAHNDVDYHGDASRLPPPPPCSALPSIFSAACAIIADSTYRAYAFFLSPAIRCLFLNESQPNDNQRHLFGPQYGFCHRGEPLLPPLHIPAYSTVSYSTNSKAFPALRSLQSSDRRAGFAAQQRGDMDHANAVCSWLIVFVRSMQPPHRLKALRLLALVSNAIDADFIDHGPRSELLQKSKEREKQLCYLAIPLAVELVQVSADGGTATTSAEEQKTSSVLREEACDVLALVICGKKELQTAAIDAGAIKHVCPILRKSFDNVSLAKPMWPAKSISETNSSNVSETRRLGPRGMPNEVLHAMNCRKSALEAIAALAAKEDVHRKSIVESGVVQCIIDSMKPFPVGYLTSLQNGPSPISPKDGNTIPVILAACHAALSMSRSVAALRTSLIDAGLGKPIFSLLTHENIDIQIAATNVCTNLVLEFSALREDFLTEGVVKVLTEHARSNLPALRLPSLWALKHLVLSAPKDIKINTLEQLGPEWLVGAIQGDQLLASISNSAGAGVGLSTPNAAGEQVDLLNPSSMDIDDPMDQNNELEDEEDGEVLYDESSSTHYQASRLRSTLNPSPQMFDSKRYLSCVKELETNPALQAKRHDIAAQEQALDFMRNLLNGEDCESMFEHLMAKIGCAKVFELLTVKLSPVRTSSSGRLVYHPTELLLSTVHILTHISNASPKHRQLLISQKQLLQAWLPHFNHADRRVRVMSVWAVNSLTWIADGNDRTESRQRVRELKSVGIEAAVRSLQHDPDLDVRERTRTALRQIDGL